MKLTTAVLVSLALFCSAVEAKKNKNKQADEAAAEEGEGSGECSVLLGASYRRKLRASTEKIQFLSPMKQPKSFFRRR